MLQTTAIFNSLNTLWGDNSPPLVAAESVQTATRPYAIVDISLGETDFTTGSIYDQDYYINITTWVNDSIGATQALGRLFYSKFSVYTKLPNLTDNAQTMHILPLPMNIVVETELDIEQNNMAGKVFKLTCVFEIKLCEFQPT